MEVRTGRLGRWLAVELAAVPLLVRLFPRRFSFFTSSPAGPGELPSHSRRAQISPAAHLSQSSLSWFCSTCPRTCTTEAMRDRDFFYVFFLSQGGEKNKITPSLAIWPRGPKPGGAGEPHSPSPPVLRPEPERFLARSFGSEHLFSLLSCYSVIFPPFLPCYRRITLPALSRPRGPGRGSLPSFGETRALFGGGLRTASPALRGGADSPSPREEKLSRLAFPSPCEQSHPSPSLPDSRAVICPVPAPHG